MSQETYKPVIYFTFLLHVLERLRILKCPYYPLIWCFPDSSIGKEQCKRPWFNSLIGKVRWRRDRLPTPYGSAGKEFTFNEGDLGLIPGLGRSPGEGKGYPLQYSGLENSMDLYSPWGHKESDMTERLSLSLSWWLKPTSYKQERRIQKGFYAQEPQRVLLSFISTAEICKHHELELFFLENQLFLSVYL